MPSTRTNWHEAVTCAIQIDLRDYSHLLEYHEEYFLDSNNNYIDLLVIKKNSEFQIPKHIASIFQSYNLFETKGLGSSLTTDAYYKTNGHACYYINTYPQTNGLTRKNITLTFPTFHYPRNLLNHLTKECNKTIDNPFPGVYYISEEMFLTQILVIKELSPEDSMYLYCLTKNLTNLNLINNLTEDYQLHKSDPLYASYLNQFLLSRTKGEPLMVCEGIFKLYGTSSEEIMEQGIQKAQQIYLPQIEQLTSEKESLNLQNSLLVSEISKLKQLLAQNNIAY